MRSISCVNFVDYSYERFIRSAEWRRIRNSHLKSEPLCRFCRKEGKTTIANQVDHIEPCGDDFGLQRDRNNLRSLCSYHHAPLRHDHSRGFSKAIGVDGLPVDERHPFNR
jgi:5-methylcytosine-specific restriction protein A